MNLETLKNKIKDWANERELLTADPNKQFIKLLEEAGELAESILKQNKEKQIDAIGDIFVVLTILSEQLNFDITEAVNAAYNEIKDRKGKTVNGVFIKEDTK